MSERHYTDNEWKAAAQDWKRERERMEAQIEALQSHLDEALARAEKAEAQLEFLDPILELARSGDAPMDRLVDAELAVRSLVEQRDAMAARAEKAERAFTNAIKAGADACMERDEAKAAAKIAEAEAHREIEYLHSQWDPTVAELRAALSRAAEQERLHAEAVHQWQRALSRQRRVAGALRSGPVHSDVQGWCAALAAELEGE